MEKVNLDTEIDDIYFGKMDVRIRNCLRMYDVETLRKLVAKRPTSILDMHNMGKKSRMAIEDWLDGHGLHLGMTKEEIAEYEGVPAETKEEEGEVTFSDTRENLFPESNDLLKSFVSEEMRCEIYRLAGNLLLEYIRKGGRYPDMADLCGAAVTAVELYKKVRDELKKLKE